VSSFMANLSHSSISARRLPPDAGAEDVTLGLKTQRSIWSLDRELHPVVNGQIYT
jgi:hypothetical protein